MAKARGFRAEHVMKVVVAQDSGMEEIMHQRDRYYREDDEIQRCIDVIKNVKKA